MKQIFISISTLFLKYKRYNDVVISERRAIMNRAGGYITNNIPNAVYQSFRPSSLPPSPPLQISEEMNRLLIKARCELAELDVMSRYIPNIDLFISMYVRKEALLSSQIEGTQCTLEDILDPDNRNNANLDTGDVINAVKAIRFASEELSRLPLCSRLLKMTHAVLLSGVRGQEKNPGEFRRSQNWIGPAGSSLKDARYIPPNLEDMAEGMNELEKYFNRNDETDPLIKAALIHYQFETIHPFLDGNGRIGRLLILLYLMDQGLLKKPVFYPSLYLKKNQVEYYDRMSEVRRKGNYEQWVNFFLEGVLKSAEDARISIEKILVLRERDLALLSMAGKKKQSEKLFRHILEYPIITVKKASEALHVSYNTASSLIREFCRLGILEETTSQVRNRVFVYTDYLNILKEGTE